MKMKWIMALLAFSAFSMSAQAADEPIVIGFSHVVSEDAPKGQGARLFQMLVEERLGGRVKVEVYGSSSKMNDNKALLGVSLNEIQMVAPSIAKLHPYTNELQVFDLPFVFDNMAAVSRFQSSATGQSLLNVLDGYGIKGLTYWNNGPRVLSSNKPIVMPEDVKGITLRIEPSKVFQEQWQMLGANSIAMPFSYVSKSLDAGLVNAQENTWSNIYTQHMHERQQHFLEADQTFMSYMVLTNKAFWNGLPEDIRKELESILAEVTTFVNGAARIAELQDRQMILHSGKATITTLNKEQRAQWRKAYQPLWDRFKSTIDPNVFKAALAANQ